MKQTFDGLYFKHQKGPHTVALIVGASSDHAFIQVLTDTASYNIPYPLAQYRKAEGIRLGASSFSEKGLDVCIAHDDLSVHGKIAYAQLTPLQSDIMGIFRFLPMECRHSILSLHHRLVGALTINGETIDFTGGIGYIEGDSGTSFPQRYTWLHCNDFPEKCCVVAAIADIPFLWRCFTGCICVVYWQGREYRFATYLGVKILRCDAEHLLLRQGAYALEITMQSAEGKPLCAPRLGRMSREITECAACSGRFRFSSRGTTLFDFTSHHVSFEHVHHFS